MFSKFRFFRQTKQIRLTMEEKTASHAALSAFMKKHPVREADLIRPIWQRSKLFLHPVPVALVILLLLGGGTAYAAEGALPDEPLYPIKIHVNEAIRAQLALSPTAKAEWDTEVTERRLDEAEKLASSGKLTTSTKINVLKKIEQQTQRAEERIELLKTEGDTKAASKVTAHLEASLQKHEQLIEPLLKKRQAQKEEKAEKAAEKQERKKATNRNQNRPPSPLPNPLPATSTRLQLVLPLDLNASLIHSVSSTMARPHRKEIQEQNQQATDTPRNRHRSTRNRLPPQLIKP